MKYFALGFAIILFFSTCKKDKPPIPYSKKSFLNQTKSLMEGLWIEEKFETIIKNEKLIGKAIQNSKNPLLIKINYKNIKNDSLFIHLLTSKGKKMVLPLLLKQIDERVVFEFPGMGFKTKNYINISSSIKDTLLQIKIYNVDNQLIDVRNYKKIRTLNTKKSIALEANEFLNSILLEGNYKWGLAPDFLYYQCNIDIHSKISSFDGFEKFYFILNKNSSNLIKFISGNKSSVYEYTLSNNLIRLSKLNPSDIGKSTYYLKPTFILRKHSEYFNSDVAELNIEDEKEEIRILLRISTPPTYPAKIDSMYRKIINSGFFNYKLFKDGKVISTSKQLTKKNLGKLYTQSGFLFFSELGIKQPTRDYQAEISIPKYAFKNLDEGLQRISLYIYQRPYSQAFEERKKKNLNHVYIDNKKNWLWAKVDFDIRIPKIYSYSIQLNEIKLNRFANVDFSLQKNGSKADIFWTIFYPKNKIFWQSKVIRSTNIYSKNDIVELYAYSENPNFTVIVFDEDRGSKPEIIAKRSFSIDEIPEDFKNFSFGKVDIFKVKKLN